MPHRWSELPPQDVLRILRELAARDGQAQSGFLDTHQWAPLAGEGISISLSGGHPQAQFRRAGIGLQPQVAITCLPGLPPAVNSLRMLRGWLYRNGAPDGSLGDIAQTANGVWLAVTEPESLQATGLEYAVREAWQPAEAKLHKATVAGTRADAVVAAIFNVSRGEAQTAIKYGFVFADYRPLSKQTQELRAGAQLVYRTKGRAEIAELGEHTRSGRLWIEYRYFPA